MRYYQVMSTSLFGSLFILVILLPAVLRFFFHKRAALDTAVLLAPGSLGATLLYIAAYGISLVSLVLLALSLVVCITNFRAFLRYVNGLVVDFYSPVFCISSLLEAVLILVFLVLQVIYPPFSDKEVFFSTQSKPTYTEQHSILSGSGYSGLVERSGFFGPANVSLYTFSPAEENENPVILYIPSLCTATEDFETVLTELAERGFAAVSADCNLSDVQYANPFFNRAFIRPFYMRIQKFTSPGEYAVLEAAEASKKVIEAKVLYEYIRKNFPSKKVLMAAEEPVASLLSKDYPVCTLSLGGLALLPCSKPWEAFFLNPDEYNFGTRKERTVLKERILEQIITAAEKVR